MGDEGNGPQPESPPLPALPLPALPLPAVLSQALVAFVIEFDNEFEHAMPHRTTRHGSTGDLPKPPWLVSMAMWGNCMRLLPADGIPAGELARQAQLTGKSMATVLKRMGQWWGYLTVRPGVDEGERKPPAGEWLVRPTSAGRQAQDVWAPLAGIVEGRWRDRFGSSEVERLSAALAGLSRQFPVELPYSLPAGDPRLDKRQDSGDEPEAPLASQLSKVLLAFAIDFDRTADLGLGQHTAGCTARLAVSANLLRVLDEKGVRLGEIPARTGVAKMTTDNWLGALEQHGYAAIGQAPGSGRFKLARLTGKGLAAKAAYENWLSDLAKRWATRFGAQAVDELHDAVRPLAGDGAQQQWQQKQWPGLEPYADGWRAQVPAPLTLPHFPVISWRGGFPDGS
jgi:DNA-binding MarR family transcriptional regulator